MEENDVSNTNGISIEEDAGEFEEHRTDEVNLCTIFNRLISEIFFPDANSGTILERVKASACENVPLLSDASKNSGRQVLDWTRRGSPIRALLVVSVGSIALITLTGLLVFTLFFVAATVNAVVISLLMALAAAGGFLALFFTCVAAIYIGALSVAVFFISATTISAVIAVLITTGWIGFFWTLWLAAKKSVKLAKHSFSFTSSAVSAYSSAAWQARNQQVSKKSD